jgi:hypothetical protein
LVIVLSVLLWSVPSWLPLWYLLVIVLLATMTKRYQSGNPEVVNQRRANNTMTKGYQRGNQEGTNQISTDNTMTKRYQRSNQYLFDLYLLDYPFGILWSLYCQSFFD